MVIKNYLEQLSNCCLFCVHWGNSLGRKRESRRDWSVINTLLWSKLNPWKFRKSLNPFQKLNYKRWRNLKSWVYGDKLISKWLMCWHKEVMKFRGICINSIQWLSFSVLLPHDHELSSSPADGQSGLNWDSSSFAHIPRWGDRDGNTVRTYFVYTPCIFLPCSSQYVRNKEEVWLELGIWNKLPLW